MKNKIIAVILTVIFISASFGNIISFAQTDTVGEINKLLDDIVAFNLDRENESHTLKWLAEGAGNGTEFYAIAFSQRIQEYDISARYDLSAFASAMEQFLEENDVKNAVTKQKYALSLIAAGKEDSKFINEITETTIGELGIMSFVFGLHLLNNGAESSTYTVETITEKILSLQLSDGGWALTGQYSDTDITAMTVQALAPHKETSAEVSESIDKAIKNLSERQLEDGDFSSYGVANPDSVAQVIIALTSVGIDPLANEGFVKNGNNVLDGIKKYLLSDGSFKHTEDGDYNPMATYQVFLGLTALNRFYAGKGPLFIFEEEYDEPIITEDPVEQKPEAEQQVSPEEPKIEEETPEDEPVKDIVNINKSEDYKLWITAAIIIIAFILIITAIIKRQKASTFILILVSTAILICIVMFTDIQTADDYYSIAPIEGETVGTVTMQIRCDKIKDQGLDFIPESGIILEETEFEIAEEDTVYDVLIDAAKQFSIHLESTGTDGLKYISGLNYIYELDFGDLSGWVYYVNGERLSVGSDAYTLNDGDVIEWHYSLELGNDID